MCFDCSKESGSCLVPLTRELTDIRFLWISQSHQDNTQLHIKQFCRQQVAKAPAVQVQGLKVCFDLGVYHQASSAFCR